MLIETESLLALICTSSFERFVGLCAQCTGTTWDRGTVELLFVLHHFTDETGCPSGKCFFLHLTIVRRGGTFTHFGNFCRELTAMWIRRNTDSLSPALRCIHRGYEGVG